MRISSYSVLALALPLLASGQNLPVPSIPEKQLTVTRPALANFGDEVTFSCKLATDLHIGGDACSVTSPSGAIYDIDVSTGALTDHETANPVQGLNSTADPDGRNCEVIIASFTEEHVGEWKCMLPGNKASDAVQCWMVPSLPNIDPYHEGLFFLLTPVEDHVHDVMLPQHLVPVTYDVALVPFLNETAGWPIAGKMGLDFTVETHDIPEYNSRIVLHIKDIVIDEGSVVVSNSLKENKVIGHSYHLEREEYIVDLEDEFSIDLDSYRIEMDFTAYLNNELAGFYRSSYVNDAGDTVWIATTQFEATDARRAFPCMDEPAMKAKFSVKLGHEDGMNTKSNMPMVNTEPAEYAGYTYDVYEQTVQMSTYLLAFVVSDFETTQSATDEIFSVYHIAGIADQAAKANVYGPTVLRYYEEYFDIPYPLPKMDMGAIPDFDAGAMENWGLILYREHMVLFQEGVSSLADEDLMLEVIAHELAHQWFGNLVTMEWWTDLWLNEGFATYVACIGTDHVLPQNQKVDRTLLDDMYDVFNIDALETSKAISIPVDNPYYDMTFSRLSYGKGNCILRMIEHIITKDTFNHGVTHYLNNTAYGNAKHVDLWRALDEDAHLEHTLDEEMHVGIIMEGYTRREGYPVLTVTSSDADESTLSVEQKRFLLDPAAVDANNYLWYIPITVAYPGGSFEGTKPTAWVTNRESTAILDVAEFPYVLNVQETGYYRVNYDASNWNALIDVVKAKPSDIHKLNRAQLLDDSFNLARAGQLGYEVPLSLAEYISQEDEYIPLKAYFLNLNYLDQMFRDTTVDGMDGYPSLQDYVKTAVRPLYDAEDVFELTEDDEFIDASRKATLMEWMCLYGSVDCINQASNAFSAWMHTPEPDVNNPIEPDFKQSIYKVAIGNGGDEEFGFLWSRLANIVNTLDTEKIINGLASSESEANLLQLLEETVSSPSIIRAQDARYVYRSVGKGVVGRVVQFAWLDDNFNRIRDFYGALFTSYVVEMLDGFMSTANSQPEIDALNAFVAEHRADLGGAVASIEQGIDSAEINMAWVDANYVDIAAWLDDNVVTVPTEEPPVTTVNPNATTTTTTAATTAGVAHVVPTMAAILAAVALLL